MWETVELRELRVFLALAEELHFGRTAERLGLTRSRVSQSLRELEAKLGGQLVNRTNRHVSLTPAGERFQQCLVKVNADLDELLRGACAANNVVEGRLRLGIVAPPAGGPYLTAIATAFEQQYPQCTLRLAELSYLEFLDQLRRGGIDAVAARLPLTQPGLVIGPILSSERRVLALARDHPLAAREAISIEDVADYAVAPYTDEPKEIIEDVIPRITPGARTIRRLPRRPATAHELLALIARGEIVHPTVRSFGDYFRHPDVTVVPITDLPDSRTALVWRRGLDNAPLRAFVRVAREFVPAEWQDAEG